MANKSDPRNLVLNMLSETLEKGHLSRGVREKALRSGDLSEKDAAFAKALYTGVLKRLPLLDYIIEKYSNIPLKKIRPAVKNILRISVYQMFYMDSVPERAALSEALRLLEKRKMSSLKGYVNGVLRAVQREGLKEDMPDHIKACAPGWIYERVCEGIGKEEADAFFFAGLKADEWLYACLNTAVYPKEYILDALKADGIEFREETKREGYVPALKIKPSGELEKSKALKCGMIYIQSPNSQNAAALAAKYCENKTDPFIMDVCAAPGGKSIDLAVCFPEGKILSVDKTQEKVSLLSENISGMGLENIKPRVWDACIFDEEYKEAADIVIADVPCSGLGVIDRKPDIKYRLRPEDIPALSDLQRHILSACKGYVKEGGVLVYSTCTLLKQENEQNALWFEEEAGFKLLESRQYTTFNGRADGFYAAVFKKI